MNLLTCWRRPADPQRVSIETVTRARASLDPNESDGITIRELGCALESVQPTRSERVEWTVAVLEWLDAAAQQPADRIQELPITEITIRLAKVLPQVDGPEGLWTLWALANAALCLTAPGQSVLADHKLADTIASAAYDIKRGQKRRKNKESKTPADQIVEFALLVSSAKPAQLFVKLDSQRPHDTPLDLLGTLSALCTVYPQDRLPLAPRVQTDRVVRRRLSGQFGLTAQAGSHTFRRVWSEVGIIIFTSLFLLMALGGAINKGFFTLLVLGEVPKYWAPELQLDGSFVISVLMGLLTVIATIGVAFAISPSDRAPREYAAVWAWHRIGTGVARVSAIVSLLVSLLFFASTALTPIDLQISPINARRWAACVVVLVVALLSVVLSSAIASWQHTTGYGRWTKYQERAAVGIRCERANDVAVAYRLQGRRRPWSRRLITLTPLVLFEVVVIVWEVIPFARRETDEFSVLLLSMLVFVPVVFIPLTIVMLAPSFLVYAAHRSMYSDGIETSSRFLLFFPYAVPALVSWSYLSIGVILAMELDSFGWWVLTGSVVSTLPAVIIFLYGVLRPIPDLYLKATRTVQDTQDRHRSE